MPDANPAQSIFDQTVRHRIAIERYSAEDSKKVLKFLDELRADIASRIARATPGRRAQLESILDDVREIHGRVYQRIQSELSTRFRDRAAEAAEFHADKFKSAGIEASINRLTADAAYQAALTRPMDGAILSEWLTTMEPAARNRIDRALRISFTEGESLDRAVRRVREQVDISKRSAKTLIRTANTHISNAVQQASAEANADLVKEVEWRSVLDSRTTPVCQMRSGQRYPINSGPRPPAHPGCRSIVIEVLKDFPPPKSETYAEWLKRQPAEVQDDILGPNRGALLRSGRYDVGDFVDVKGTPLTLAEIRAARQRKVNEGFAEGMKARAKGMASFRKKASSFRR